MHLFSPKILFSIAEKFCSKFWLKSGLTYFSGEPCQKLRNDEGGKSGNQGLLSKHLDRQQSRLELKISAQIFGHF